MLQAMSHPGTIVALPDVEARTRDVELLDLPARQRDGFFRARRPGPGSSPCPPHRLPSGGPGGGRFHHRRPRGHRQLPDRMPAGSLEYPDTGATMVYLVRCLGGPGRPSCSPVRASEGTKSSTDRRARIRGTGHPCGHQPRFPPGGGRHFSRPGRAGSPASRARRRSEQTDMGYVAVKGGNEAIERACRALCPTSGTKGDSPPLGVDQIKEQLYLAVDRVMGEGSPLCPGTGGPGPQAVGRGHLRGLLHAARLSGHPAAPGLFAAGRYREDAGYPPDFLGLQGYSRRPDSRRHQRLHPASARFRSADR